MPSQPRTPPLPLPQPEYPFQQIVSDYFQEQGHHYLVIADRFSGWPTLLFCGDSTASHRTLIDTLKMYFSTYGIPEELASDGGKTYVAYETQKFLSDYGVHHRLSSVAYPHSNQRAELAVKSMKRLLRENIGLDGKLNTDRFQRAVMQYRNTPDRDTGRSPAQVIFGRELRDFLPAPLNRYKPHQRWLLLQEDREKALRKRALQNTEKLSSHTRLLPPLEVNDTVQVQNQIGFKASRWDITGVIVEVKNYDQYLVKIHGSGRLTLRNRKFLKKIFPYGQNYDFQGPRDIPVIERSTDSFDNPRNSVDDEKHGQENKDGYDESPLVIPTEDIQPIANEDQVVHKDQELRRSSRIRKEPDRLNIESWSGKSYEQHVDMTAPHSVANHPSLHHDVPGGGGGITGYVKASGRQPIQC